MLARENVLAHSLLMLDVIKHKKSTRVAQDVGEGDFSSLIFITANVFLNSSFPPKCRLEKLS